MKMHRVAVVVLILVLGWVTIHNTNGVLFRLGFNLEYTLPLFVLMVLAFLLGVLLCWGVMSAMLWRKSKLITQLHQELAHSQNLMTHALRHEADGAQHIHDTTKTL